MNWLLKDKINSIIHPFKYGFWCIMCVGKAFYDKHSKLGMLWETYDSYAGDGDYGFNYWWTGHRKTWKELHYYNKFGWDDEGYFQFILPFFLAWLIVLPGTIVYEVRRELEMRRYEKDWREGKI